MGRKSHGDVDVNLLPRGVVGIVDARVAQFHGLQLCTSGGQVSQGRGAQVVGFSITGVIGENVDRARALQIASQFDGWITQLDGFVDAVVQPGLFVAHGQKGCDAQGQGRGRRRCEQADEPACQPESHSATGEPRAPGREQDCHIAASDQQEAREVEVGGMHQRGEGVRQCQGSDHPGRLLQGIGQYVGDQPQHKRQEQQQPAQRGLIG